MASNSPSIFDFESRLYPSQSSEVGFLSHGQKLSDVLQADADIVSKHGITLYQLGCILERLVLHYVQGQREVDGKYKILNNVSTMSYQECPFHELDNEHITYGRSTMIIQKIGTEDMFIFESLLAHLIKEHGFCEGPGTPYRLDLEAAIAFFDVKPEIDYTPQIKTSLTWHQHNTSYNGDTKKYLKCIPFAIAQYTYEYFIALVLPGKLSSCSTSANAERDILDDDTQIYDLWHRALEESDKKDIELRFHNKFVFDYTPDALQGKIQTHEELKHKLDQSRQQRLDKIRIRIQNFRKGVLDSGLRIIILGHMDFAYPSDGLAATLLKHQEIPVDPIMKMIMPDMEPEYQDLAQFDISDLSFSVKNRFIGLPFRLEYKLHSQRKCL